MKRLLFIAHRVPYPPDKGERARALQEIKALSGRFRITLAALAHTRADDAAAGALKPWCQNVLLARGGGQCGLLRGALWMLGGKSVTEGYFHSRRLEKLILREHARERFDLVLGYASSMLHTTLCVPAVPRVMDLVDVDSAKWDSYADSACGPLKWLYRTEARRVRALEERAARECDALVLTTGPEVEMLSAGKEKALAVPHGVDLEQFAPPARARDGKPALVFTGTMNYPPNVEAVCWFAREVWPELKRRVPELTFAIVGRDPTASVRRLARTPGIVVTGPVPDVRPYLSAATVAVVPLLTARGLQSKTLEAMATGLPVVISSTAARALEVEGDSGLLEAQTPQQWQDAVTGLLKDNPLRRHMGERARQCVQARYDWTQTMKPLVALCRRLAGESDST